MGPSPLHISSRRHCVISGHCRPNEQQEENTAGQGEDLRHTGQERLSYTHTQTHTHTHLLRQSHIDTVILTNRHTPCHTQHVTHTPRRLHTLGCALTHSGLGSTSLLKIVVQAPGETSGRQFRQRHSALNINTAPHRTQRSRAREITCDKLEAVVNCVYVSGV